MTRPLPQTPTAELIGSAVASLQPDLFAILDGGLYDNLAVLLRSHGLRARPVFLEAGDADAVTSGPYLVPLDSAGQIEGVTALAGGGRTPVIWSWQEGELALYRHLRRVNLAIIEHVADDDLAGAGNGSSRRDETVIFRHWDPVVLGAMAPLLTAAQTACLLGTSAGVMLLHDEGITMLRAHGGGAPGQHTSLRFRADQVAGLGDRVRRQSDEAVAAFLNQSIPEVTSRMRHGELLAFIESEDAKASRHGIVSERGLGCWCFLVLLTGGRFISVPGVADYLGHGPVADARIELFARSLGPAAARIGRP